jgi:TctA family transporter
VFFTQPLSAALLAIAVLLVLGPILLRWRRRKGEANTAAA